MNTDADRLAHLEQRLDQLTRSRSRTTIGAFSLGLAAACMLGTSLEPKPADPAAANVIRNAAGDVVLSMHQVDGDPAIVFYADSQPRLTLGIVDGKPLLTMNDGQGRKRIGINARDEDAGLSVYSADGLADATVIGRKSAAAMSVGWRLKPGLAMGVNAGSASLEARDREIHTVRLDWE